MRQVTPRGRGRSEQPTSYRLDEQTSRLYKTPLLSKEFRNKSLSESNESSEQPPGTKILIWLINTHRTLFLLVVRIKNK